METKDYALLVAVDLAKEQEVIRLLSSIGGLVDGVKIGTATMLACGTQIVRKAKEIVNGPVVADLKVADIGFQKAGRGGSSWGWSGSNSKIIEAALQAGVDYVICHTIVGSSSIRECVEVAHGMGGKVLTLPYMTHEGAGLFFDQPLDVEYSTRWLERESPRAGRALQELGKKKGQEAGWRSTKLTLSDLIMVLGEEYGVDGYVAPGNKPEIMSDYRKVTGRLVLAPGVGRQGGRIEDVYRILGPRSVAAVGEAIYGAEDPVAACKGLLLARERAVK